MGIPLYFKKISNEFVNITSKEKPSETVSRLYLDFNCAIHYCSNKIKETKKKYSDNEFETLLIHECKEYIMYLKDYVNPIDLVYASIDGVVPMAKITQQRKRRFFSDFKNKSSTEWNSNAITPGTLFMKRLIRELNEFSKKCNFHLIIDAERGEGEHKICHHIRQNDVPKGLDVIYGLDADMILLTMLSKNWENTYLLREDVKNNTILIYMSIKNTKKQIHDQFTKTIHCKNITIDESIKYYTTLTFLLGNDFLPHLSYISLRSDGITKLLNAYKETHHKTNTHILHENDINLDFFSEFIRYLSLQEDKLFYEQEEKYYKTELYNKQKNDIENYPIMKKFPRVIHSNKAGWRSNYYYYLFCNTLETSVINDSCKAYMQGIVWMTMYYFKQETEWYWYYHYNYSPTIVDLSNYLMINKNNNIQLEYDHGYPEIKDIDQLIMVLPRSSMNILPEKKYHKIVTDVRHGQTHNFPISFEITTFMKYKLHECGSQGLFLDEPIFV